MNESRKPMPSSRRRALLFIWLFCGMAVMTAVDRNLQAFCANFSAACMAFSWFLEAGLRDKYGKTFYEVLDSVDHLIHQLNQRFTKP